MGATRQSIEVHWCANLTIIVTEQLKTSRLGSHLLSGVPTLDYELEIWDSSSLAT